MSSKKLMAAALAAMMAVGTVSTVAFAEGNDAYTWVIDGTGAGDKEVTSAVINPYWAVDVPNAIYQTWVDADKKPTKDGDTFNYTKELSIALWESTKDFKFTEFKGGTATLELKGTAVEWVPAQVVAQVGGATGAYKLVNTGSDGVPKVMVPKLKDGSVIVLTDLTGAKAGDIGDQPTTVEYKIATKEEVDAYTGTKAGDADPGIAAAAQAKSANTKIYKDANGDLVFGESAAATDKVSTKSVSGKQTVNIGAEFRDASGNVGATVPDAAKYGLQTGTVQFTPSFEGLSETVRLETISDKSTISVDVSGTVDGKTWYGYYYDKTNKTAKWAITGTKDYTWNWLVSNGTGNWNPGNNAANGFQMLLGYPGASGVTVNGQIPNTFKSAPSLTEENLDYTIPTTLNWTPIIGSTTNLGFGNLVSPEVLKNLNAGGTITFEFDKELKGNEFFTGAVIFGGNNGAIANSVDVSAAYGSGKSVTVDIPAGLTYYKDEKNPWQSVGIGWSFRFEKIGSGIFNETSANHNDTDQLLSRKIVKMTFKANGAPAATTSGSGTTSGNQGGQTTSGTKDPNGNPPTGIALAVAPVILAAGAVVAVSASKKRK